MDRLRLEPDRDLLLSLLKSSMVVEPSSPLRNCDAVEKRSYSRTTFSSFDLTQYHSSSSHKILNVFNNIAKLALIFKVLIFPQIKSRLRHYVRCNSCRECSLIFTVREPNGRDQFKQARSGSVERNARFSATHSPLPLGAIS